MTWDPLNSTYMYWGYFEYYIESMITLHSFGFHSIHIELTRNQLNDTLKTWAPLNSTLHGLGFI